MKEKLREIIRKFICTVIAVALGVTIVEVIIKKIKSRNITSVIDAILKFDSIVKRCFKAISLIL